MKRLSSLLHGLLVVILVACATAPARPTGNFTVTPHPDGPLYVGDQVSFEVTTSAAPVSGEHIEASFEGKTLGSADFQPFGVGGRAEAALWWVWDTHGLQPGSYTLTFTDQPVGNRWTETVFLRPADLVPPPEPGAHWAETTTTCCTIYYITGTDAARDISTLGQVADQESAGVAGQMNASLKDKIDLVFMPRVLGQGGFTMNAVYVSYLDRNYVDNDMSILLHHEFVHYYDGSLGGNNRPSILEEGLAVYLTGGHFKTEPVGPRAAALLDLGWYIPLQTLADDFYNQQHEIGYIEAAGLVKYLAETYGWNQFNSFYRSIPADGNRKTWEAIDVSLREHLGITFDDLEAGYQKYLKSQTVTDEERRDLELTVRFFDTVRRYQKAFDPSAYFLTAWLPDGSEMRRRGIVADLVRHPGGIVNRYLEAQLIGSWKALIDRDYDTAERTLNMLNRVMDLVAP